MLAAAAPARFSGSPAEAASIVAVVNNSAVTSGDIAKRAAFLRLQNTRGNVQSIAKEQLIDEALKREEILRLKMSVSTSDVDAAFGRFASGNKLSPQQLSQILERSGVGVEHFKAYIAVQMSWPRVVNARYGRANAKSFISRVQENDGKKPVTTEYFLQQVIFVVPEKRRGAILGKRKAEAEASRSKYPGCDAAKVFAATMHDVSIRELGRVLEPELPDNWKPLVMKAEGQTTGTLVTERGVEYLGICKKREVNDDVAAEMVFRAEDLGKTGNEEQDANSKRYIDELRSRANITMR
ncbi:peptidylprolyl isomerase [Rhizobium sp. TRM95111]|nr:peptidylprolyl isomerase [Rhizobium alarense]MCF3642181.1 peptidylprolyl isomerase [Rhizobium alarense]